MNSILFKYSIMCIIFSYCMITSDFMMSLVMNCVGGYFAWNNKKAYKSFSVSDEDYDIPFNPEYILFTGIIIFILSSLYSLFIPEENINTMIPNNYDIADGANPYSSMISGGVHMFSSIMKLMALFNVIFFGTIIGFSFHAIRKNIHYQDNVLKVLRSLEGRFNRTTRIKSPILLSSGLILKTGMIKIISRNGLRFNLIHINENVEQEIITGDSYLDMIALKNSVFETKI